MEKEIEIKPGTGIGQLIFGVKSSVAEEVFGKPDDIQVLDELEDDVSTVFHYWRFGFSLFFDQTNNDLFTCVEIDCQKTILWGITIFDLNEKQIIDLLKSKGYTNFESETHEWGEKRVSFDKINIDFYFEKNKLVSINFGNTINQSYIILPN